MGTKSRWFKWYSQDYLTDALERKWSLREHGVFIIASCILWTETDEPGLYIIKGKPKSMLEFARHIAGFAYANESSRLPTKQVVNAMSRLSQTQVIEISQDGVIYCPHIVNQVELMRVRQEAGKKGGNPLLNQKSKWRLTLDKIRKR